MPPRIRSEAPAARECRGLPRMMPQSAAPEPDDGPPEEPGGGGRDPPAAGWPSRHRRFCGLLGIFVRDAGGRRGDRSPRAGAGPMITTGSGIAPPPSVWRCALAG